MPIYEYRCTSCGRTFELLQRLDEPPATVCSECQGELEKLFSAPSFQFKGSGWYATDYAQRSGSKDASDDGAASTKSSDSTSKSGDTKSGDGKSGGKSSGESSASPSAGS